ncbi:hypothetical protein ACELLULO517_20785 [Acidisoma cellulosilytica]|uniref:Uncharacterized protein n=1 Tax=Acidisoma cellulosilyticum TaxID=2802395 RepID=A0A964E663_9PROT|nr:hypothetical protein [Acidisoma cellulosilyticum]MCB8882693.1 hypothetical protein [Acidisoma cellulosilyticum]
MADQPNQEGVATPLLLKPGTDTPLAQAVRAQALLSAPPDGTVTLFNDPLSATVENPTGAAPQARGIQQTERIGPLIDMTGLTRTIIHFPVTTSHPFAFGSAATPFGVMPIRQASAGGTHFTLGAGSVWFATNLMVPGIAAGSFSGFRISSGTLTASAALALQSGTYVAPTGTVLTLTATLAPATASVASGSGVLGEDFTAADLALPTTVTIIFTTTTAKVQSLGNASLTVYGSTVGFTFADGAAQAIAGFPAILIPCAASVTNFAFTSVISTMFTPAGTAKVNAGGWSLPITVTTVTALGEASGAGSLVLELGTGASLTCAARHNSKANIGGWLIDLDTTELVVIAGGTGPASLTPYTLWKPALPATVRSTVAWINPSGFIASLTALPGQELLATTGSANVFLDRPLAVDGGALPITGAGTLFLNATATSTTLSILTRATVAPTQSFSLALENALIGVLAPQLFFVAGPVADLSATQFLEANTILQLKANWLLPTLPDPYAASFDPAPLLDRGSIGLLTLALGWTGEASETVSFTLTMAGLPGSDAATILPRQSLTLLDLSTRVDLFGVRFGASSDKVAAGPAVDAGFLGLSLAVSDAAIESFALPQVSWEPMINDAATPPEALAAAPATDGVPTLVHAASLTGTQTQRLVRAAPEPVLLRTIGNVASGASFSAQFSLPFGLIAYIGQTNRALTQPRSSLFGSEGGVFALIQPQFAAGGGAYQLTLKPPHPDQPNATFGGSTAIYADGAPPGYGTAVLGTDIAPIFAQQFSQGGGVPVLRADLAGYGASIWSEWLNPTATGTHIIKVQFETVTGRTAYEVVKAQTILYPYGVRLVRTVTIARQNAGWVQRQDSGWVAASQGLYHFPSSGFTEDLVNRGAIAGVFNVRNIREFETVLAGGFTYRRVLFDADVGLDYRIKVKTGGMATSLLDAFGKPVTLVPARDLTGYAQMLPEGADPAATDLAALFGAVGPITDAFACIAEIGGTASLAGTALRCSGLSFDMTPGTPTLGAALLSSPVLPSDGAWGFGKRAATATAPQALPPGKPVPLVQAYADPGTWHFADIADLLRLANPASFYGLLQDTGTQKTLFEQPTVKDLTGAPAGSQPSIQLPAGVAPALADLGSLLGATGLFPDIAKAISFLTGAIEQLQTIPQGLQYTKDIAFTGNEDPTTLIDLGVLQVALIYADTSKGQNGSTWKAPTEISFNIDPAHMLPASQGRNWWLTITPISFAVTVPEFGSSPILTIIGGFAADDRSKPGLTGLTIDYGSALDTIKTLLSKLQALASFLPGGLGAGLDVSLSNGKLTVRDTFALPTLPLGLGNLSDISLDLGLTLGLSPLSADFIVGIGDPGNPFNWVVSPLAGNGAIDLGVKAGQPDFLIQGGIGLGLSIDVGIAEGSASITLAVSLEISGNELTIIIILNGQASVDVLGGLASASLSLTAAVGVSIQPFPPVPVITSTSMGFPAETITFLASVAVGIHISICWVISVDFEGSWSFSQSVSTPALTIDI